MRELFLSHAMICIAMMMQAAPSEMRTLAYRRFVFALSVGSLVLLMMGMPLR